MGVFAESADQEGKEAKRWAGRVSRWKEMWRRAIAVWLVVMAVEFVHGTFLRGDDARHLR